MRTFMIRADLTDLLHSFGTHVNDSVRPSNHMFGTPKFDSMLLFVRDMLLMEVP